MSSKSNIKLRDYLSDDGKLDLSILDLKSVPNINDILALRKVRSIDLSNNQIESLPDDLIKLENIHTLILSKNRLTQLPENFGQLKHLKQLDLFENSVTDLPISFAELTKLEYLDLKNNPLDANLQIQAGKCLNKKECRLCAQKVVQYMKIRQDEYEKEQTMKLKKKQANERAKARKRVKQAEKEREEKRLKRAENARQRTMKKQNELNQQQDNDDDENTDEISENNQPNEQDQSPGLISETIDGILYGLLLSLMIIFAYLLYYNRHQPLNLREFYKYI